MASATPSELAAIDAILKDRPEFTVYVNIAPRVQRQPSTLIPGSAAVPMQGLPWVLALARAELGGMLATFGKHPVPFAAVRPTRLEAEAYKTLLMDGSQTHYWAIFNDPNLAKVARSVPDTQMLAYIRRLNAVRHFLRAGANAAAADLQPPQVAEILREDSRLDTLRQDFIATVSSYLAARTYSTTNTQVSKGEATAAYCKVKLGVQTTDLQLNQSRAQSPGQ